MQTLGSACNNTLQKIHPTQFQICVSIRERKIFASNHENKTIVINLSKRTHKNNVRLK